MSISHGPQGDAFLQDPRTFVDERIQAALQHLVIRHFLTLDAKLCRSLLDNLHHLRIRLPGPAALRVDVEAARRLLAKALELAELVCHPGRDGHILRCAVPASLRARQPRSRPTRSFIWNGPMGMPKPFITLST